MVNIILLWPLFNKSKKSKNQFFSTLWYTFDKLFGINVFFLKKKKSIDQN